MMKVAGKKSTCHTTFRSNSPGWHQLPTRKQTIPMWLPTSKADSPVVDSRRLIDFEGVMYTADIYVNMKRVGGTNYGYVGFEIDITNELKYGEDNLIEVVADTREPGNSRWYTGGGLIRNVSIVATPKDLYFGRHPLYITTRENRFVSIGAEFTNRTKEQSTHIAVQITGPDGETVYNETTSLKRHKMARTQEERIATERRKSASPLMSK